MGSRNLFIDKVHMALDTFRFAVFFPACCLVRFAAFLAEMSSSRSDNVTKSGRLCVRSHFVKFAVFKAFEARVLERSSTGVSGKFQWCFKEVSKKFQGSFKSISRMFQGYLGKVSRLIEGHS